MSVDSIVLENPPIDLILREEWSEWGLCTTCGLKTHDVVVRRDGTIGDSKVFVPLTVPGAVQRGQCMSCCDVSKSVFPDLLGYEDEGGKRGRALTLAVDDESCTSIPQVVDVPQGDDTFRKILGATRETKKTKNKKKTRDGDSIGSSIATSIESSSVSRSIDDSSASNGSSVDQSSSDEDSSDDDVSASSATYVTGNGSMKGRTRRTPLPSIVSVDQPNSNNSTPNRKDTKLASPETHRICRATSATKKATELKREWSKPARPAWTAQAAIVSHEEELQRMLGGALLEYTGETHLSEDGEGPHLLHPSTAISVGSSGKESSLLSAESESSGWVAESKKATRKPPWMPGQSARKIISRFRGAVGSRPGASK